MRNRESCRLYFDDNKEILRKSYPGLNYPTFEQYFLSYNNCLPEEYFVFGHNKFFKEVEKKRPLQYITNQCYFYKSEFYVDERVLIPRSETEIIVEHGVSFLKQCKEEKLSFCEVGSGSGCLGVSLLKDLQVQCDAVISDIDKDALEVTLINLLKYRTQLKHHNIQIRQEDRLFNNKNKFNLIISNPPYIPVSKENTVHDLVLSNEPYRALFIEDNEYDGWFELFFKQIRYSLKNEGQFLLEVHEDTIEALQTIGHNYFKDISIIKDYTGRKRFLKGNKNG